MDGPAEAGTAWNAPVTSTAGASGSATRVVQETAPLSRVQTAASTAEKWKVPATRPLVASVMWISPERP